MSLVLVGTAQRGVPPQDFMSRFLFKLIICALLATAASVAWLSSKSGDPIYTLQEWISPARFQQHDALIRSVAAEHHLDPMLVKAVVWRESRFDAQKFGSAGERGLMQVSEKAAQEWARKIASRIFAWRNCSTRKSISKRERGICGGRCSIGKIRRIRFPLRLRNTTPAPAERSVGLAAMTPSFHQTLSGRTSISPGTRSHVDSIIARL